MQQTKYKHTDIGIIPEDWEVKTLGEIGHFSKGKGMSREQAVTGTIPSIRYGEIYTTHNDCIRHFNSYISSSVAKQSKLLTKGDLLFTASGETKEEIGKCVAYTMDCEAYAGGDIIILSPLNDVDSRFFGYYLNTKPIIKQKAMRGQGDAVVHITTESLKSIQIILPPIFEQQRIAAALSDVDELIASIDNLIQKKQLIKQGAMQQLLTAKRRIKGFNQPWEEKRLGEIITTSSGGTPSRSIPEYYFGEIKWFTTSELNDCPLYDSDEHITEEALSCSSAKMFPAGTLLMAMYGATIGKLGILTEPAATNQACCAIFSDNVDLTFLFYLLLLNRKTIVEKGCGAGQPNISQTIIKDLNFCIPPSLAEQKAIAQILTDMDNEIEALRQKKAKTEDLKQAMMQQLLTGKIRFTNN